MKTKDEESVLKAASERGIQHKKGTWLLTRNYVDQETVEQHFEFEKEKKNPLT